MKNNKANVFEEKAAALLSCVAKVYERVLIEKISKAKYTEITAPEEFEWTDDLTGKTEYEIVEPEIVFQKFGAQCEIEVIKTVDNEIAVYFLYGDEEACYRIVAK